MGKISALPFLGACVLLRYPTLDKGFMANVNHGVYTDWVLYGYRLSPMELSFFPHLAVLVFGLLIGFLLGHRWKWVVSRNVPSRQEPLAKGRTGFTKDIGLPTQFFPRERGQTEPIVTAVTVMP